MPKFNQASQKQQQNMLRYKYTNTLRNSLNLARSAASNLSYLKYDYCTEEEQAILKKIYSNIRSRIKEDSKTYTVCKSCRTALTGRKPRSDIKYRYWDTCQICKKKATEADRHYRSTLKFTLKEAQEFLLKNHPELFI